jgi:hypothetical protein
VLNLTEALVRCSRAHQKDKKVIWICLGILAGLYCIRSLVLSYMQARAYQQAVQAVQAQRAAAAKAWADAQKEAQKKAASGPVVDPVPIVYMGNFAGNALLLPKRGMCIVTLMVSPVPGNAAQVQGYSSLRCTPPMEEITKDGVYAMQMAADLNQASTIMTGAMEDGKLHFKVTQSIGVDRSVANCPMTSATATPFATGIAFDWKEDGECGGGQMILNRGQMR